METPVGVAVGDEELGGGEVVLEMLGAGEVGGGDAAAGDGEARGLEGDVVARVAPRRGRRSSLSLYISTSLAPFWQLSEPQWRDVLLLDDAVEEQLRLCGCDTLYDLQCPW